MRTIRDVLKGLKQEQRDRIASRRARRKKKATPQAGSVEGLAASYNGDWAEFLSDMSKTELLRALTMLDSNELRIAVLRAFDGRVVTLNAQLQTPKGIIERLCHTAPQKLQANTWKTVYAKILQDVGWKSDRVPRGLDDSVRLQPIFDE